MPIPVIPGLVYVPEYVTEQYAGELWETVHAQPWRDDLTRRVQHYGWRYDYKSRSVTREMNLGELPDWAQALAERLHRDGHLPEVPDQLIVNEYEPGQGISPHIDCEPCFTDTICSLSLGSQCLMDLEHVSDGRKLPIQLEPRSLLVLGSEARYQWRHGIAGRRSDLIDGVRIPRSDRISLTFRRVILEN